jgi:hypothetical protein
LEAISRYTKEDALEKLKMEYQTKDNPFQKWKLFSPEAKGLLDYIITKIQIRI